MAMAGSHALGSIPVLAVGHLERLVGPLTRQASDGYPPYDISQIDDTTLRITLAVAGFARSELSITVGDRRLVIRGRRQPAEAARVYLHRGIGGRPFQRSFILADGAEVKGATLDRGLLSVELACMIARPGARKIAVMPAGGGAPAQHAMQEKMQENGCAVED
jgi:HSP20 family molecular chaperone IbpA